MTWYYEIGTEVLPLGEERGKLESETLRSDLMSVEDLYMIERYLEEHGVPLELVDDV